MKHQLVRKYEKELQRRNYARNTVAHYTWCVEKFISDVGGNPYQYTVKLLDAYLTEVSWSSVSQQSQMINAMKLFYSLCLGKKNITLAKIERPRKEHHLPKVIDINMILGRINAIDNLKHKAILSIAVSVGLRVGEVIRLKVSDIDSKRMQIKIIDSKGHKDRLVPLSEKMLIILRQYYKEYEPQVYLFEGQHGGQYSKSSCNKIFKKYIDPQLSFHSLRHSCFTSLLERGTDITIIQKLAGHAKVETTQIYAQVSNALLSKVKLPM